MYLRTITLNNIKSLRALSWALPDDQPSEGWHVLLGDNASGKSTFMRATALALLGPQEARGIRADLGQYLTQGTDEGSIGLRFTDDRTLDGFSGQGNRPKQPALRCNLHIAREPSPKHYRVESKGNTGAHRHIWGSGPGWFSASFGPMRRFSGGDKENERLFVALPKLAAHLSVFGEDVALTEIERWLGELAFQRAEQQLASPSAPPKDHFLDRLIRFINQPGLLPHGARWEQVSSKGVFFRDGHNQRIQVDQLSDGFRSVLCLALELIRQLEVTYQTIPLHDDGDRIVVPYPGVVLIDEIDAHLHPTWQREVGFWFTRFFPKLQFIVSTHSPLVCQAAESGTIFKLPSPQNPDAHADFITGEARLRLLHGDILSAYSTEAFGHISVSPTAERNAQELARLAALKFQQGLTEDQQQRVAQLQSALPTSTSDRVLEGGLLDLETRIDHALTSGE